MSKLHPIFEIARTTAWVQVCKPLMMALGNDEAIIFGELLSKNKYFTDRDELTQDGYFFNTMWDLASDTNLNDHRQRLAINKLVAVGLLKMKVKGIPPKRYFRIQNDPNLFVRIIEFGVEKALRMRQGLNSQIFKELILNDVEKPICINKPNGDEDSIAPEQREIMQAGFIDKARTERLKRESRKPEELDG